MTDIAGSLKPGLPADITVFRVDSGAITLTDTTNHTRPFDKRIVPTITFKNGERIDCDLERCQDERNWLIQIAEDHEPEGMKRLTAAQVAFLGVLAGETGADPLGRVLGAEARLRQVAVVAGRLPQARECRRTSRCAMR